jgi:hypothetical protein
MENGVATRRGDGGSTADQRAAPRSAPHAGHRQGNRRSTDRGGGKANATEAQNLKDQLELAKAVATLDQDEVDDAQQDLMTAGGNPQSGFDEMIRQHEAASKASDTLRITITPLVIKPGLVAEFSTWQRCATSVWR